MEIKHKIDLQRGIPSYIRRGEKILTNEFFEREQKFKFEISNGSLNVVTSGANGQTNNSKAARARKETTTSVF